MAHAGAGGVAADRGGDRGGPGPASPIWPIPPTGSASGTRPARRARRSGVHGMLIWGFTAFLVDMLLALGGWERPWDRPERGPPAEALAAAAVTA